MAYVEHQGLIRAISPPPDKAKAGGAGNKDQCEEIKTPQFLLTHTVPYPRSSLPRSSHTRDAVCGTQPSLQPVQFASCQETSNTTTSMTTSPATHAQERCTPATHDLQIKNMTSAHLGNISPRHKAVKKLGATKSTTREKHGLT